MATETAAAVIGVIDATWQEVVARRIDDLDLTKEFLSPKLKGFVLKSHHSPTYESTKVVTKTVPGISLNSEIE